MSSEPWWRSAVVYQVYPRSFADSDGDGVGDLIGVVQRLDYLAALGVDVVWLSPVYRSPMDDNGYDVSDYRDVDPLFGTLADLDELIAGLHARGMRLIMDLIVNHSSDEHPWFVESRSSVDSPKRDWYWWRPPRPGHQPGTPGAEPTNWRSFFSGPTWTYDEATGEYYLHLFSRKQPDLNWENPEVRAAVYDMMRWWLSRGVDGFRMDVINLISKDGSLPDGAVASGDQQGDGSPYYTGGPRLSEYLAEMHRAVFDGLDREPLLVAEMPGVTVDQAAVYTHPARREVDMVFAFDHLEVDGGATKWDLRPFSLVALKAVLGRWQDGLAEAGWNSLYWDNHDQPRVVSRFGDDGMHRVRSATLLATVLHLHRGTPYIFQGEELGMTNMVFAGIEDFSDIESVNHYTSATTAGEDPERVLESLRARSRDNARTPMQWDDSAHAGFTTGEPWSPVNPNYERINAAAQMSDPGSVFSYYQRLIALRHCEPAVGSGDFTMLLADDPEVYAFTRRLDDVELLVLANFGGSSVTPAVPDAEAWAKAELVLGNIASPASGLMLDSWEARVHRRHL